MNVEGAAPSPLVLEGLHFKATAKIAGVNKVPLSPGATPFVPLARTAANVDPNLLLVRNLFEEGSEIVTASGTERGRILHVPLALAEAACLLDRLEYSNYRPDPLDPVAQRWSSLEAQIGLTQEVGSPLLPLFRSPTAGPMNQPTMTLSPRRCPYQIAAYLRFWAACLERNPRGLFPTNNPEVPWHLMDFESRRQTQPRFWIGLRFGGSEDVRSPSAPTLLDGLPFGIPAMKRSFAGDLLVSTWGTRNPSEAPDAYRGDQFFDYHHHGHDALPLQAASDGRWRPAGADGLLLFHVVQNEPTAEPFVAVGLSFPTWRARPFCGEPTCERAECLRGLTRRSASCSPACRRQRDLVNAPFDGSTPAKRRPLMSKTESSCSWWGRPLTADPRPLSRPSTSVPQPSVGDPDLQASRLLLPNEPWWDAVAAFICRHLLESGYSLGPAEAFSRSEPVIALALYREAFE